MSGHSMEGSDVKSPAEIGSIRLRNFATGATISLLTAYPVYLPRSQEQIGIVYLTASARLFTDRLSGYAAEDAGEVYLRTGEGLWRMDTDKFLPASLEIVSSKKNPSRHNPARL